MSSDKECHDEHHLRSMTKTMVHETFTAEIQKSIRQIQPQAGTSRKTGGIRAGDNEVGQDCEELGSGIQ